MRGEARRTEAREGMRRRRGESIDLGKIAP